MAERPDLEYALPILDAELRGVVIAEVLVKKPVVVRVATRGAFVELLTGTTIEKVERRGHFAVFSLEGIRPLDMAVSPMLAGRFRLVDRGGKDPHDTAVAFRLGDGRSLIYRDDVQMGKVYVLDHGAYANVPGLAKVGIDALDPKRFTKEAFRTLAKSRRDQAKVFLLDKAAIDSLGNAYADESLFEARIHPKAWMKKLDDAAIDRLHDAIVLVLGRARDVIRERKPPIDEKLRDFLSVRGRAGEACVRCKTKLRRAGVHGHDAIFCPTCQPDERESSIVDWRKLPPKEEGDAPVTDQAEAKVAKKKPTSKRTRRSSG